jgi:hypothetical protein
MKTQKRHLNPRIKEAAEKLEMALAVVAWLYIIYAITLYACGIDIPPLIK